MLGRHMHTNSDDVAFLLSKGPFVLTMRRMPQCI